jgi:hypothetical protein
MLFAYAPRVFDYFLAYTLRYGGADIGHYTHMRFAHGNDMIKEHHSLALHQNEGLECCNSEDKQNQQAHGMHGGCNADMCNDCAVTPTRKLTRYLDGCSASMCPDDLELDVVPYHQYRNM